MPVERRERVIAIGIGSTGNGRNLIINGRRQPSCGDTSRMNREVHVRFCEGLGVKFPGPTRPSLPSPAPVGNGSYRGISCRTRQLSTRAESDPSDGPAVSRKRFDRSVGFAVLHQCIRSLIRVCCARSHHGYQRACGLISGQASSGAIWVTRVRMRREEPVLHLVSSSRRPRQENGTMSSLSGCGGGAPFSSRDRDQTRVACIG
jgi:hypothetical protein